MVRLRRARRHLGDHQHPLGAGEVEYFAGHCGAVAAIAQPSYAEMISAHCKNLRWLAVISHDAGAAPAPGTAPQRADSFEALFADGADRPRRATNPFAPCSVQYTLRHHIAPEGGAVNSRQRAVGRQDQRGA